MDACFSNEEGKKANMNFMCLFNIAMLFFPYGLLLERGFQGTLGVILVVYLQKPPFMQLKCCQFEF